MKPSVLKEAIKSALDAKLSVFIWGQPGCGKSSIVYQISEALGKKLHEMRALLYEPIDVRGFPVVKDGVTSYCPPEELPKEKNSLLFVDELNQAPMMTQNAFLQLVIPPHKLGTYTLPSDCGIIAAGNRETDRAGATRMGTALANRFVHMSFEIDTEEWLDWAIAENIAPEIYAFIRYRSELLSTFDKTKSEKAFASPRSYEFLSKLITCGKLFDLSKATQIETITGTIGEGAATEFIAFVDIWQSLPNPDEVLAKPNDFSVDGMKPNVLYALCGAIARKANVKNESNFFTFAKNLPGEWSIRLIHDATKMEPKLKQTKGYIDWASKFAKYMI